MVAQPISLELRDSNYKYFIVYKNGQYYSDVVLFPKKDNLINITSGIKNYLKKIMII